MIERAKLTEENKKSKYLIISIVLLLLSMGGIFYLILGNKKNVTENKKQEPQIVEPTLSRPSPTPIINETVIIPTGATVASETATPIPSDELNYADPEYNFFVIYSNKRKLYPEEEASGKRFNFYSNEGSITLHAGEKWSWQYPERNFTTTLLVGGVDSFIYKAEKQRLVDFEKGTFKYTIQCIHNNKKELEEECDKFIADFRFL